MIVEILSVLLGSSLVGTVVTGIMYWKSSKKIKESEALKCEAEANLKKTEARIARTDGEHKAKEQLYDIISELNSQIKDVVISSGDQIDLLNKHLQEEIEGRAEQTTRLRICQDELLNAKNDIIALTTENAKLKEKLIHYMNWVCERDYTDCNRRKPEQKVKCPYSNIE